MNKREPEARQFGQLNPGDVFVWSTFELIKVETAVNAGSDCVNAVGLKTGTPLVIPFCDTVVHYPKAEFVLGSPA